STYTPRADVNDQPSLTASNSLLVLPRSTSAYIPNERLLSFCQLKLAPSRYWRRSLRNARAPSANSTLPSRPQLKLPHAGGATFNASVVSGRPFVVKPGSSSQFQPVPNCNSKSCP